MIFVRYTNLEIPSPNFADPSFPILFSLWNFIKIMIRRTRMIFFLDKKFNYNFIDKILFLLNNRKYNLIFVRFVKIEIPSPNFADSSSPISLELLIISKLW